MRTTGCFSSAGQATRAAYATLAQRHYRRIFALCLGMLANVHDAEDIAQETLLKGFQNLHELARPERFEPSILQIAKNLCIDVLRRRKRARKLPVEFYALKPANSASEVVYAGRHLACTRKDNRFVEWVLVAMAELADDGTAPEDGTYQKVLDLAQQVRASHAR